MRTFLLHSGEAGVEPLLRATGLPHGTRVPAAFTGGAVIGWGRYRKECEEGQAQLQPVKAVLRCLNRRARDDVLKLHGIKTLATHGEKRRPIEGEAIDPALFPHLYRIPVFQLEALAVFGKREEGIVLYQGKLGRVAPPVFHEIGMIGASFHVKRAVREAVQAIYALGLDYGLVTVGVPASGHTLILDVEPEPQMTGRNAELFADAIARYDAMLEAERSRTRPAVIGADPEFLLLGRQGKVVAASRFVKRDGEVGCDSVMRSGQRVVYPLAELRPQPSESPRALARHLERALRRAARVFGDPALRWVAGGMPLAGFALGGHIHLSRVPLHAPLLRALDNYLALPMLLAESDRSLARRPRYGALGDFRRQPHGGFEYRTLASWLVSPVLARGAFALTKLIAEHSAALRQRPLDDVNVQRQYYGGDKRRLAGIARSLWRDLERLPAYAAYAAELDALKGRLFTLEPWNEDEDFRPLWGL